MGLPVTRELKSYAEPVTATALEEGKVYFSVQYADESLLIPIIKTWVFVGKDLQPGITEDCLYFQDVESYLQGVRYETATQDNSSFQVACHGNIKHIFEFGKATEELLKCEIRRQKSKT
jgi:hypothetical protein